MTHAESSPYEYKLAESSPHVNAGRLAAGGTMSTDGAASTYRAQRKAAERNHAAILEVARELLAASPTVSMNEIAKRAGVGAGTLYRHFPAREDLILAVYRHDVQRLTDSVDELWRGRSRSMPS